MSTRGRKRERVSETTPYGDGASQGLCPYMGITGWGMDVLSEATHVWEGQGKQLPEEGNIWGYVGWTKGVTETTRYVGGASHCVPGIRPYTVIRRRVKGEYEKPCPVCTG